METVILALCIVELIVMMPFYVEIQQTKTQRI